MDHAAALVDQNRRLADLLADADWTTPVPTCPGWTLTQLLRHVGRGDRWAAQIIADRADAGLDPRQVRDGKPPADPAGTVRWLTDSPRTLLTAVREIGQDTTVATFLGPRPASWWVRRRLHEATVHRADAALALDVDYTLPADLAVDGIAEWLDRLVVEQSGGPRAALSQGAGLLLRATDTSATWTVRGTSDGITWTDSQEDSAGDVRLAGPATDLLLALVRRKHLQDTTIQFDGDPALWQRWLDSTPL